MQGSRQGRVVAVVSGSGQRQKGALPSGERPLGVGDEARKNSKQVRTDGAEISRFPKIVFLELELD